METVYTKLQETFGLNDKHILILKALKHDGLGAKKICEKTKIPQGRIYEYLNHLIDNKLVEKTHKKPFTYSVYDLNYNVIGFMKHKMENMLRAQTEVMDLMKGSGLDYVDIVNSSTKFTQMHLAMIAEAKSLKYISLHNSFPYALYPLEQSKFIKMRKAIVDSRPTITSFDGQMALLVFRTYKDALTQGKEIHVVLEKSSFDFHVNIIKGMGKKFFDYWKDTMIEQSKNYNIKAYVLDEYIPMQIDVNDRRVNISMRHLGVTSGVVIHSKDVVKFYSKIFDQNCKRAEDILPLIKKLKFSGQSTLQSNINLG